MGVRVRDPRMMRDRQKQCVLHVFKTEISVAALSFVDNCNSVCVTSPFPLVVAFIHYISKLGGNIF